MTMTTGAFWWILLLIGMPTVCLLFALRFWWEQRRLPAAQADALFFRPALPIRILGVLLMLLAPLMLYFALASIPFHGKHDLVPIIVLSLMLGGVTPVLGFALMLARFRVDEQGLTGYTLSGKPAYLLWSQIERVSFDRALQLLRFEAGEYRIHVFALIQQWEEFLATIKRYLPDRQLPVSLCGHGEAAGDSLGNEEMRWQNSLRGLRWWLPGSGLVVLGSLFIVVPHWPGWILSACAGLAAGFAPTFRSVQRKWQSSPAEGAYLAEIFGVVLMSILFISAFRSGLVVAGEQGLGMGVALWLQLMGIMLFNLCTLLLVSRYWQRSV